MTLLNFVRRPLAAAVALGFLTGCVTGPDGKMRLDDKAKAALIGAAAGCGVAAAAGKDCAKGAVVGAVAGFVIGWYFESKKLADAKTVNQQYASAKGKDVVRPPKKDIVPVAFTSQMAESPVDSSGKKEVQITSNTDLIGYGDKVPEVKQKYAIYDEQNKLVEEKTEKLAAVDGAGRYESKSKITLPPEAKGKKYTVKTELVADGKTYKQNAYTVSFADDGRLLLAMN